MKLNAEKILLVVEELKIYKKPRTKFRKDISRNLLIQPMVTILQLVEIVKTFAYTTWFIKSY